jgi:hypothetical protein
MKKLIILFLLVPVFSTSWAQNEDPKTTKGATPSPDFPGAIVFEYGLNYLINNEHSMRTNPWKSATFNVYFTYPVQINGSRFAFIPGVGIGSEKYGFEDAVTFYDSLNYNLLENVLDLTRFANASEVKQTQFIANYVDFPLEIRIHSRKDDHKRSFFVGIGGKVGVNFAAKTKIKYAEYGSNKTSKDQYHFNVNTFRFGGLARIGYGPISGWFYYSGSQLFRGNKSVNYSNPSMWSFGLSLATF